jgi:cell division septum initiation protein DivIVA
MSAQQSNIYNILGKLEEALDKGFPLLSSYMVVVKRDTVEMLLDNIYASLPTEVQDARALLRRREEIQHEAQQRAEKVIRDAQAEVQRLLSESDLIKRVNRECQQIKEQVVAECDAMKRKAMEEADAIRSQAQDDVLRTKEGASVFAEQVLTNLEQNLNQLQQMVKGCQVQMERQRSEAIGGAYAQAPQTEHPSSFKVD